MASDFDKYRAQIFQIAGFALTTPFGRLILKLIDNEPVNVSVRFLTVLFISAVIGFCGIMLLLKGLECVETRSVR